MRYKDDWDQAKQRLSAFWDQEILDRVCISVTATENLPEPVWPSRLATDAERYAYWTDAETIIRRERNLMEHTYYGGDAFPKIWLNLGASGHAAFFRGANYQFGDSLWFFPSLEELENLEFDEKSPLYRKTLELAKAFAEDSRGDYIVTMPDDSGNADVLAHLRGSENFLPDMLEDPDTVKTALDQVQQVYDRIMRESYEIVKDVNYGGSSIGWLTTWAPGFHAQMQCDLSVMISNDLYEKFIMKELRHDAKFLEYPLYHLDGVEQTRHLDSLLSIPELRAIQWTQVAGQKPCTAYFDFLRKIQEAGKSLVILVEPQQVEEILETLSSRGLYLVTSTKTKDEAQDLVKLAAKLTHD